MKGKLVLLLLLMNIGAMFGQGSVALEKIVILDMKAISIDKGTADLVTEGLITSFFNLRKYQIVERAQLNQIINELRLTNTDLFTDDMALEIGRLAMSRIVVVGSVGQAGGNFVLNIRTIEVETGVVVYSDRVISGSLNELLRSPDVVAGRIAAIDRQRVEEEQVRLAAEEKARADEQARLEAEARARAEEQVRLEAIEQERLAAEAREKARLEEIALREEQFKIYMDTHPYFIPGVALTSSGAVVCLAGVIMLAVDLGYLGPQIDAGFAAGVSIEEYNSRYNSFVGVFGASIGVTVLGLALVGVGIPLMVIAKDSPVSLDLRTGNGLELGLSYKW